MSGSHTFSLTATTKIGPDPNSFMFVLADLIGCRKRQKFKVLINCMVVFVNDPLSAERRIDFAVFFIVLWSYGRKIWLNMCHGNSENSYGCSYLVRICVIYGE